MAHFRGILRGNRGAASRLGGKGSGLTVEAQSWQGKVVVYLRHDERSGTDEAEIYFRPHNGAGGHRLLYRGPVSGEEVTA